MTRQTLQESAEMIRYIRASFIAAVVFSLLFFLESSSAQSSQAKTASAGANAVAQIELTYKRDPRLVDPTRPGMGPIVVGPNYSGANAQDTVETMARVLDAKGQPLNVAPEWTPSDPEMVTITPAKGDHVKITVHRPGESRLKITAGEFSKELIIRASKVGQFINFQINQPAPPKPRDGGLAANSELKSVKEQVSYAIGANLAASIGKESLEVDDDMVEKGYKDVRAGGTPLMSEEEVRTALARVQTDIEVAHGTAAKKELAEKNKKDGEVFLEENKKKEGVVTLPSGLQYKVIKAGEGKKPKPTDFVSCHYRATFIDGKEFDSSYKHNAPANFPVNGVIKGWQEALQLMPEGSKWQLFVPSELAYGERGAGGVGGRRGGPVGQIVGPNTALVFEVELLSVSDKRIDPKAGTVSAGKELPSEILEKLKAEQTLPPDVREKLNETIKQLQNQGGTNQ
jgi:FKBP-type peptidyl-prolyl cis-trans isomerase FklB